MVRMISGLAMALGLALGVAVFLASDAAPALAGGPPPGSPPTTATRDTGVPPALQPGWQKQGSLHIVGPTVNAANPVASKTVEGPYGPITATARFVPAEKGVSTLASGAGTCVSEFLQLSYRFTTYTAWQWDYSSVTWMGSTSYSQWALPLFYWDNFQTWNDWGSGWQYAWGNGRATLKYGVSPVGASLGSIHNNALVDAWGNCTPNQYFSWF